MIPREPIGGKRLEQRRPDFGLGAKAEPLAPPKVDPHDGAPEKTYIKIATAEIVVTTFMTISVRWLWCMDPGDGSIAP
jgi:hypothetical protein